MRYEDFLLKLRDATDAERRDMLDQAATLLDDAGWKQFSEDLARNPDLNYFVMGRNDDKDVVTAVLDAYGESKNNNAIAAVTAPESEGGAQVTVNEQVALENSGAIPSVPEPMWVRDLVVSQGGVGGTLTNEQRERVVWYVNKFYGGAFRTFGELAQSGFLDARTPVSESLITSALQDTEPTAAFKVDTASGNPFVVEASEFGIIKDLFQVDSTTLTAVVRLADAAGLRGADGKYIAWQPLLAFMKYTGNLGDMQAASDTIEEYRGRKGVKGRGGESWTGTEATADAEAVLADGGRVGDAYIDPLNDITDDDLRTAIGRAEGDQARNVSQQSSTVFFGREYNRGMELYEDPAMAYVHATSPGLAARIHAGTATGRDAQLLARVTANSGFTTISDWYAAMPQAGYAEFQGSQNLLTLIEDSVNSKKQAEDDGGSGAIRSKPDPIALDEKLRELYQTMFFAEPDEATLSRFRGQIDSAVNGAAEGDQIDWGARAQQFARQDPKYQELYGNKPETMSEDDYRYQFEMGQASMLGPERAGNASAMAGMRTGNYQTAIGAATGTKEAWDNSQFLGRLASAAQAINEMT